MTAGIAGVLIICAGIIFVAVMGLAVLAIRWRPAWLAPRRVVVWGGIAFPFVVLSVLLVYSATRGARTAGRRHLKAVLLDLLGTNATFDSMRGHFRVLTLRPAKPALIPRTIGENADTQIRPLA